MKPSIINWFLAALVAALGTAQANSAPLETSAAELRQLPQEFRLDGVVEATQRTTVSAQTSGQVQDILYDVDDYVEKDTVLVILKDIEHQARLNRATADLTEAEARLEEARDEFNRTKEVHAKQLVADAALDKAEAALKSARARYESARAGLAQAQEQLDYTRVRAPYSGVLTERHVEPGEVAQPGQALLSGISLDQLRVTVDVPQSQIARVREFAQARVELPDGSSLAAQKLTVFPIADPASNTFKVRLELAQGTEDLFPGMFVKTAFVTGQREQLVIPAGAVVYRSEVTGVYVVAEGGRVQFRHVRLGRLTGDGAVAVLAGLIAGERVALDPIAAGVELKRQRAERSND
jgi:RND family efflux transporter MFP subunit